MKINKNTSKNTILINKTKTITKTNPETKIKLSIFNLDKIILLLLLLSSFFHKIKTNIITNNNKVTNKILNKKINLYIKTKNQSFNKINSKFESNSINKNYNNNMHNITINNNNILLSQSIFDEDTLHKLKINDFKRKINFGIYKLTSGELEQIFYFIDTNHDNLIDLQEWDSFVYHGHNFNSNKL